MLNSGMRQIEIAKALGVGKGTIANLVCRNDLHDPHFPERRQLPGVSRTPRAVHVQRMLFAGMRQVEIAAAMGLTPATISGIVKRNKLRDSQSQSHGQHGTWKWTVPEPSVPIVVPKPPRPAKSDKPFRMSLTPLSQYLAAGRQMSVPRDA